MLITKVLQANMLPYNSSIKLLYKQKQYSLLGEMHNYLIFTLLVLKVLKNL